MVAQTAQSVAEAFNIRAADGAWGSFCDAELAFEHPALAAVLELWRDKAGSRPIPARSDFSLRVLKAFLPDIALYERVALDVVPRYRVRIMGASFAETMGDLTGKFLDDVVPEPFLQRWYAALDAAFVTGSAVALRCAQRHLRQKLSHRRVFSGALAGRRR